MGLGIYDNTSPAAVFSVDGAFTNPLTVALDGATGAVRELRLYVRNDGSPSGRWYSGITIQPIVSSGEDVVSGPLFTWKLIAGDTNPTEGQWAVTTAGDSISVDNIGSVGNEDLGTYSPFWLRIEIPKGASVSSFDNVKLRMVYTENLI